MECMKSEFLQHVALRNRASFRISHSARHTFRIEWKTRFSRNLGIFPVVLARRFFRVPIGYFYADSCQWRSYVCLDRSSARKSSPKTPHSDKNIPWGKEYIEWEISRLLTRLANKKKKIGGSAISVSRRWGRWNGDQERHNTFFSSSFPLFLVESRLFPHKHVAISSPVLAVAVHRTLGTWNENEERGLQRSLNNDNDERQRSTTASAR